MDNLRWWLLLVVAILFSMSEIGRAHV